jgi:periplasmic protein TonB
VTAHVDILDARESWRKPLLLSVALHGSLVAAIALAGFAGSRPREQWGSPNSLGGSSVGITPVSQIPLPARGGPVNPLANDTESRVPEPPPSKQQAKRQAERDAAAIALKSKSQPKRPARNDTTTQRSNLRSPESPGQLYSSTGRALSSPMVGQTGSGGVGMGQGGAFGSKFGYYHDLLEQRVGSKWRTNDVDSRLQTAPTVIVTFSIHRDGSMSNLLVEQSSGNRALDYAAERAIREASPFPPLPAGYDRNEAKIEFWFQLIR